MNIDERRPAEICSVEGRKRQIDSVKHCSSELRSIEPRFAKIRVFKLSRCDSASEKKTHPLVLESNFCVLYSLMIENEQSFNPSEVELVRFDFIIPFD